MIKRILILLLGLVMIVGAQDQRPANLGDLIFDDLVADSLYLSYLNIDSADSVGIEFAGAYKHAAIDFSGVTLNHTGSAGPVMIRAGTYGSPVESSDPHQSGMIRLYGRNSATTDSGTGFYDRIIFANHQITGNKGGMAIAGLIEVRDVGVEPGPANIKASEFIVGLEHAGAKLATSGSAVDGMFASWMKVYSKTGSVAAAGSIVAPAWIDNQMSGTVSGEEYGIFATSGTKPDAFIGFQISSAGAGWETLFKWDETCYNKDPIVSGNATTGSKDYHLKVDLNGTIYGIQLYAL